MQRMTFDQIYRNYPEIYQQFHSVVDHTENYFAFLQVQGLLDDVKSVLDIGGGFGDLAVKVLEKYPQIKWGYVEPSTIFVEQFKKNLQRRKLGARLVESHDSSFETYQPHANYDLSLSIHSWYAFGENEAILEKAIDTLGSKGKLCISIVGPDNITLRISKMLGMDNPEINSEVLSQWILRLKIAHEHLLWDRRIPLEKILKGGEFTSAGKGFLQFHVRRHWKDIPSEWVEKVKVYLESSAVDGTLILQNGCVIIRK